MACDSGALRTGAVESSVWWEQQRAVPELSAVSKWHYRSRSGGAAYGLLPGTSSDFKYGLLPGTSSDFKYGLLPGTSSDFNEIIRAGPTGSCGFRQAGIVLIWLMKSHVGDSSALIMNKLKCPHCNYVAKYRRTLKRHLLIHTGVRSFSCDICGKLFTRREHVKRHSLVHKKDKKYKCMVCKKIFMLAASVGIRHGSRRYGVCVDCADKSQPGGQEGADQVQDTDFPRDEEYEENEVGEGDEELGDDVEEQNDQSRWDESGEMHVLLPTHSFEKFLIVPIPSEKNECYQIKKQNKTTTKKPLGPGHWNLNGF
ncbi:Zinc finger and BTB domain-containing protein 10 isoform X2 [Aix galericulata]|nr:Zinc finger and BTB domain-containing protein 10 isoform X2 [Aix galericulata]